jgi:hypothetical protein
MPADAHSQKSNQSPETKSTMLGGYGNVVTTLSRYWAAYGGLPVLLRSPYLHLSLLVTLLCWNQWTNANWWESPLSALPNVLGFSLGGYAILIGFGDEKFKSIISGSRKEWSHSPFIGVSAAFMHFIIVQLLALILALVAKALYFPLDSSSLFFRVLPQAVWFRLIDLTQPIFWMLGYLMFVYSLFVALAAALNVFRLSNWFDDYATKMREAAKLEEGHTQDQKENRQ